MKEELESIERNGTWELVKLPKGKKAIGVKWVYKVKHKPNGKIAKYKARLVAKGFLQNEGIDYNEVFAPVARLETMRMIVAAASNRGWPLYQMDVKSAFLNDYLEEEVYILQPPCFEKEKHKDKVYWLRKALNGLKQSPRAWNMRIDGVLAKQKFSKCKSEHGVYVRADCSTNLLLVYLYVDDLLVIGSSEKEIHVFKQLMMAEFEMTDLGKLSHFLGLEFIQVQKGVLMHQSRYAQEVLRKFGMLHCNLSSTPAEPGLKLEKDPEEELVDVTEFRRLIGSLRYLCNSRPNICFAVSLISRFMKRPRLSHMQAAKRVLRLIKGTIGSGVLFPFKAKSGKPDLLGYTDSDWKRDPEQEKSTGGYLFMYNDAPVA